MTAQKKRLLMILALWITACNNNPPALPATAPGVPLVNIVLKPTSEISVKIAEPTPTFPPTVTPAPTAVTAAARVNDQAISLENYYAELRRYIASQPNAPAYESAEGQQLAAQLKDTVLEVLVEQALIEQEAAKSNVVVTDEQVAQELNVAVAKVGGKDKFVAWLAFTQQTEAEARQQVKLGLLTNALAAKALTQLPRQAEYVHAYHIVVESEAEAEQVLNQLNNATQFEALAQSKSIDDSTRADGGDLGWFMRGTGSVLWSEIEDAAFLLGVGETSSVIKSPIGFHILKVVAKEPRALSEYDAAFLQQQGLKQWMSALKASAKIERFI